MGLWLSDTHCTWGSCTKNFINYTGAFVISTSIILTIYIPTYCKPNLIGVGALFLQHQTCKSNVFQSSTFSSFTKRCCQGIFSTKPFSKFFSMIHSLQKYCKLALFAQKKTFLTSNDLLHMQHNTQLDKCQFQHKHDNITLSPLAFQKNA